MGFQVLLMKLKQTMNQGQQMLVDSLLTHSESISTTSSPIVSWFGCSPAPTIAKLTRTYVNVAVAQSREGEAWSWIFSQCLATVLLV